MNILYVSHEEDIGGASHSLLGIIDILSENNNIFVLTYRKEGKFVDELKKRKCSIIYCPYSWWIIDKSNSKLIWNLKKFIHKLLILKDYILGFKIKKYILNLNIDIIHTNSSVVCFGAILSSITKIPHIWHLREFGIEDFSLYPVCSNNFLKYFMNKNTKTFIAVSEAIKKKYLEIGLANINVVYNGVKFNDNIIIKNPEKNYVKILISGRVCEAKGQEDAVKAIKLLLDKGYKNIKLFIAGEGNIQKIRDLAKEYDIEQSIILLGYVKNLNDIRKDITLELVCSKSEAFGRVTVEAMMSRIPVIGADTGGTVELIKNGYNGYLYKQGDFKDLAKKIEKSINDEKLLEKMSQNAYKFAQIFTKENNATNIINIYQTTIIEN